MNKILEDLNFNTVDELKNFIKNKASPLFLNGIVVANFCFKGYNLKYNSIGVNGSIDYKFMVLTSNGLTFIF